MNSADRVQTAKRPSLSAQVPEVEVFRDEQGYEYRFINPGKHVYCRDVLLRYFGFSANINLV